MGSEATIKLPENVTVPGLIVFGDSIADQGNNNNLSSVMKCNFPPYGIDFTGGLATGRFTNGRTPSDMIGTKKKSLLVAPENTFMQTAYVKETEIIFYSIYSCGIRN